MTCRWRSRHRQERMKVGLVTLTIVLADGRVVTWEATDPADVLVRSGPSDVQVSDYWEMATDKPLLPGTVKIEVLRHPGTRIRVLTARVSR